jgi:hypothetical protein
MSSTSSGARQGPASGTRPIVDLKEGRFLANQGSLLIEHVVLTGAVRDTDKPVVKAQDGAVSDGPVHRAFGSTMHASGCASVPNL